MLFWIKQQMANKIHKLTKERKIICEKVPDFSDSSSDWRNVTCKYCLRFNINKKCFICKILDVTTVFTNTRGVKHYYCRKCAKRHIKPLTIRSKK